jgi:hypothetical protein
MLDYDIARDTRFVVACNLQVGDEVALPDGSEATVTGKDAPRTGSLNYRLHLAVRGALSGNFRRYYGASHQFVL